MGTEKLRFPCGVCLCIGYDGTDFHGWQAQPGLRTVQGAVEQAIDAMGIEHTPLRACSRTDAGVHALGQLASFACIENVPRDGWVYGLNGRLPKDVVVYDAQPCFRRFNPRFHAAHKRYRYLVRPGQHRDPLIRERAWQLGPRDRNKTLPPPPTSRDRVEEYLDLEAMKQAATAFVGTHDFRAFRQAGDQREILERTMFSVEVTAPWEGREDLLAIEIVGNSFLKNMVRIMAGTLVGVGQGRIAAAEVPAMLTPSSDRAQAGETAPAHGLTLIEIELARFDGPADAFDRATPGEQPRRGSTLVRSRVPEPD